MRQRDTILIVDDMEINRVILDGLFQEEYHLLEAENGEQALLLLRQPIQYLTRLCLRTLCSLAALAALSPLGPLIGVGLGVNLANALVMGLLGVPGFGLLLMLNWALAR